jgi:hypothetical protein
MPTCVEIEIADDGKVSVGVEPQNQAEYSEPKDYLKPAASVEEALATAKSLLDNVPGQKDAQDQQTAADEQQGFEAGYKGAQGTPMFEQAGAPK